MTPEFVIQILRQALMMTLWLGAPLLVIGFLALLRPPFGTALGIYTIWVLLPQQAAEEYDQLSRASVAARLQPGR